MSALTDSDRHHLRLAAARSAGRLAADVKWHAQALWVAAAEAPEPVGAAVRAAARAAEDAADVIERAT